MVWPTVRRVGMITVHTSPLAAPGQGDAGGLNVYVMEVAKRLASRGVEVELFTRATSASECGRIEVDGAPGVSMHYIQAGPYEGLTKHDLPAQLCAFAAGVMRAVAARPEGFYDVVHSHYWLSGQVGWLAADRWGVPLVHTMHTMARVKNAHLAHGDVPEPPMRDIGEAQVVAEADMLVANTAIEAQELIDLYDANPERVAVVHPGVDVEVFTPGSQAEARRVVGVPHDALVLTFVGRVQPLKAPDVLVRAAAELLRRRPELRQRLIVPIVGGLSGSGFEHPHALQELAVHEGVEDVVRFCPPTDRPTLAQWYRASDIVAVPSYNESFGLVAVEAQACGTPVVAARVGGLPIAVGTNTLVDGHDPVVWSHAVEAILDDPGHRACLSQQAIRHAQSLSWDATADALLEVYAKAVDSRNRGRTPAQIHALPTPSAARLMVSATA